MAAWTCLFAGYDLSVVGLSNPDRVTDRGLSFPPAENDYPNRSDRRADAATMMSGMMRLSRREVQKTTLSDDRSQRLLGTSPSAKNRVFRTAGTANPKLSTGTVPIAVAVRDPPTTPQDGPRSAIATSPDPRA